MINDRGSKKWVSLMLPEHVEALKKLWAEQEHKEKPMLDEQQLVENDHLLHHALYHDQMVSITYYEDHDFQEAKGKVLFINQVDGYLLLDDTKIRLENMIEVSV